MGDEARTVTIAVSGPLIFVKLEGNPRQTCHVFWSPSASNADQIAASSSSFPLALFPGNMKLFRCGGSEPISL